MGLRDALQGRKARLADSDQTVPFTMRRPRPPVGATSMPAEQRRAGLPITIASSFPGFERRFPGPSQDAPPEIPEVGGSIRPSPQQPQEPSLRGAVKEREQRYSLLSAEGIRAHPVASAVVHAATYGSRAGGVAKKTLEDADRLQREEEDREERRQGRQERKEAMKAPVPKGWWRDPATGAVHQERREENREPTPEETESMARAGKVWDPIDRKFVSRGANADEPVPPGKTPKGFVNVPGKGLQRDPTFQPEAKPRTEHQVRTDIVVNQTRNKTLREAASRAQRRLASARQATTEYDEDSAEGRRVREDVDALENELEQYKESMSLIDAEVQSSEAELQGIVPEGPLSYADYDELDDDQKRVYRMKFKIPKKPVGYGTVLK